MLRSEFERNIDQASPECMRKALQILLMPHASPVFGAAKTVEHEVAALNAFKQLGYLTATADDYELVDKLRITKAKARSLMYQDALRSLRTDEDKVRALREIITSSNIASDGKYFVIEVPDPLLLEDLRHRVRKAGLISDGSFSPSLARLPEAALASLIMDLIPTAERNALNKRLEKAGYKTQTMQAAIVRLLKGAVQKATNEMAAEALGVIGSEIAGFFNNGWSALVPYFDIKTSSTIKST